MKIIKFILSGKIIAFTILALTIASCSDDEETTTPAYIGTWVEEVGMSSAPSLKAVVTNQYRMVYVLEEKSYTKKSQYKRSNVEEWSSDYIEKGSLSINGSVMTRVSLQRSIGFDPIIDETKAVFKDFDAEERVEFITQWSVNNNILTLITDINENGKFDDIEDFSSTYTKL